MLEHLKHHPDTRHIPVHVMSDADHRQDVLRAGAVGYLDKPVTAEALGETLDAIGSFIERRVKHLIVVEDDETEREAIIELIGSGDDVDITAVGSSEEALDAARGRRLRLHRARPEAARTARASSCSRRSRRTSASATCP